MAGQAEDRVIGPFRADRSARVKQRRFILFLVFESTPTNAIEFCEALSEVCLESSAIFLDHASEYPVGSDPEAAWLIDLTYWKDSLASDEPGKWITEIVATYVGEAACQVRAIGSLLLSDVVPASIDLLVRGALERSGRVIWVLDNSVFVGTKVRAARAALELGVSYQNYREALHLLGADSVARQDVKDRDVLLRESILKWFAPIRPPNDPCNPKSRPTKDMTRWEAEGQKYPTNTAIAEIAGTRCGLTKEQAAGAYAGLCGYSHPSVVFARENRGVGSLGLPQFEYRANDLQKTVRMAVLTYLEALRHCASYFESGLDRLDQAIEPIHRRIDELAVLSAPDQ